MESMTMRTTPSIVTTHSLGALEVFAEAWAAGASDVHIRAGSSPLARVEGELRPMGHGILGETAVRSITTDLLDAAGLTHDHLEGFQVDFACSIAGLGRMRVHAYRHSGGSGLVARRIADPVPDFAALRLPPAIKKLALGDQGLVIVTGGHASGRSTTVASMLDYVSQRLARHIVTLEHPIEYAFRDARSTFSQREIGRDVANVEEGLEGALREDADVVFVCELKTAADIEAALVAAESGRLVIATASAPDSVRAIQAMVGKFAPEQRDSARNRIADALLGVLAQKLVSRARSKERVVVTELLLRTPTLQECIRDPGRVKAIHAALEAGTHEHGTHTFDQELFGLVRDNVVSPDAAKAAATSPHDLSRRLRVGR